MGRAAAGHTRIGSSPLRIHIGFVSSHAKQIEDRKRLLGKVPSQLVRRCSYARGHSVTPEVHKLDK